MTRSKIKDYDVVFEISFISFESLKLQIFYSHIFFSNGFHMGKKEDGPSMAKSILDAPMWPSWSSLGNLVKEWLGEYWLSSPKQLGIKMGPSCLRKVICALKQ
jgi:hypothetical protein